MTGVCRPVDHRRLEAIEWRAVHPRGYAGAMSELSGRELLREWKSLMDSVVRSAASVAGRPELPRQLLETMQRQLELVEEIVERERRLQTDLTGRLLAPADAVFDLVEQTGTTLRRQAEALEAAGRALQESARLVRTQAELFERTTGSLRQPVELAKAVAGAKRDPRGHAGGAHRAG
jgi:hypothetical protein